MIEAILADPARAALMAVGAVVIVGLAIRVWFELNARVRRYGGRPAAGILVAAGIVALLASLIPNLLPIELGLIVLVAAFVFLYRPDLVVRLSGGPRPEWEALREGRELAVLVAERGGWRAAGADPEITSRVRDLARLETPATREYLALVRRTLLADPADSSLADDRRHLAEADAALRASLGPRPTWERDLERRARGEAPAD